MTEKRFTINMEDECIDDAKEEIFIDFNDRIDFYKLCGLLNELNEENNELRQELNCEKPLFTKKRLHQENQQLKSTINRLTCDNTKMKKVLNTSKNENEQIKHIIKEAYHNERTKLGQSVLKQLMEAIQ